MQIELMDCTLRDGGYINNWNFKNKNILKIIKELNTAKIENIECGYLDINSFKENLSKFSSIDIFNAILQSEQKLNANLFLMIDYDDNEDLYLPEKNSQNQYLSGFRLAFHKKDYKNILKKAEYILAKGYDLCLQPMITSIYSKQELLEMINIINDLPVQAFYIVDSFGNISNKELDFFIKLIDTSLKPSIKLGFHPHNNLQLAFANSLQLIGSVFNRDIMIDCSVFGIGRGSGNLNTELIIHYLNTAKEKDYKLIPILELMDNTLTDCFNIDFKTKTVYFLSAIYNCHPGYASFFLEKNLALINIESLFRNMEEKFKNNFHYEYAKKIS